MSCFTIVILGNGTSEACSILLLKQFRLRGMICFYGNHYDAYFFNEDIEKWIVFDDALVNEVQNLSYFC